MSVINELLSKLNQKGQQKGESDQEFAKRVSDGVQDLTDDDWDSLPQNVQDWANQAANAVKAGKELPAVADMLDASVSGTETKGKGKGTKARTNKAQDKSPPPQESPEGSEGPEEPGEGPEGAQEKKSKARKSKTRAKGSSTPAQEAEGGTCGRPKCKEPTSVVHLGTPLCQKHWEEIAEEEKSEDPHAKAKEINKKKASAPPSVPKARKPRAEKGQGISDRFRQALILGVDKSYDEVYKEFETLLQPSTAKMCEYYLVRFLTILCDAGFLKGDILKHRLLQGRKSNVVTD